jgi:hypothetical protein
LKTSQNHLSYISYVNQKQVVLNSEETYLKQVFSFLTLSTFLETIFDFFALIFELLFTPHNILGGRHKNYISLSEAKIFGKQHLNLYIISLTCFRQLIFAMMKLLSTSKTLAYYITFVNVLNE